MPVYQPYVLYKRSKQRNFEQIYMKQYIINFMSKKFKLIEIYKRFVEYCWALFI